MTKSNHELSSALIVLMSTATGLAVASNYYAQPSLDTIARNLSLSASLADFTVTAAQLDYAAGLLFLAPFGDMSERRRLVVSMTLLAAGDMLITASSQSLMMMILGIVLTGSFPVVTQILIPLAVTLASPDRRGKVVGTVISGLLLGILLTQTVAGLLVDLGGWHTVFWVASMLMVPVVLALWRSLPQMKSETHLNYPQLLGSAFSMLTSSKTLCTRALPGRLTFANFSVLWTSIALLPAAPPFNYSDGVVGLFGFAGVAEALGARPAGGFADKGKSHHTTTFDLLSLLLSWLAIRFGYTSVLALTIGILVLDLTVQGAHITNQTVTHRIHPDTRNRLTAGYMASYFIDDTAGSLVSTSAWQHGGWAGVCLAGTTIALVNLLVRWRGSRRQEAAN